MTTSEPNEQPPTNATPDQIGEPPKPARSRRANAAAAQPSPPPPPEAPTADGDETRPLSSVDAALADTSSEPSSRRIAESGASAAVPPREDVGPLTPEPQAAAVGAPPYRESAATADVPPTFAASGASRVASETVYVPLAVSIGDGFKFGCGFFLALVMAMLIGFVLLALLFVLSSLIGLNLPITR